MGSLNNKHWKITLPTLTTNAENKFPFDFNEEEHGSNDYQCERALYSMLVYKATAVFTVCPSFWLLIV